MQVWDSKGKSVHVSVKGEDENSIRIDDAFYVLPGGAYGDIGDTEMQYIADKYRESILLEWVERMAFISDYCFCCNSPDSNNNGVNK